MTYIHDPALPGYPAWPGYLALTRRFLFAFKYLVLPQITHELCPCVQIAPYCPFCDVDGALELFRCAVTLITSRQGGMSRLFLYTCRELSRLDGISRFAETG